jgi:hypothetical protein
MLWTGRVSDDMRELLTPLVRRYDAGKLRSRESTSRSGAGRYSITMMLLVCAGRPRRQC